MGDIKKQIDKAKLLSLLDNEIKYYDGCDDRNSSDVRLMLTALKTRVEKGRFDIEPSENASLITTIESVQKENEQLRHRDRVVSLTNEILGRYVREGKEEIDKCRAVIKRMNIATIQLYQGYGEQELLIRSLQEGDT